MKPFALFLSDGNVRQRKPNPARARSLQEEAERRSRFLDSISRIEYNVNSLVENAYDILRELIEAKMSLQGYKSYSHEATIAHLGELGFAEGPIRFADELRKVRNGIKYEGKRTELA